MARGAQGCERVLAVMFPDQIPVQHSLRFTAQQYVISGVDFPPVICAETLHRSPATALQHTIKRGFAAVADDQAIAGNSADQMMKLCFYRVQIGKDVRMIELEIVEYRGARMVMHEFGTLVEKCGVVFIRFDDEEW